MKIYELLYIIPTQYTDTEIEKIMADISGLLETEGTKVVRNENLGRIKLAYPIEKVRHGSYILVHFEGETDVLKEINRKLRLTEEVLRHQIITLERGAENRKFEISSYVAPLSEEAKKQKETVKTKKIAPPTPTKTEDAPNLSMAELDKKLDKILESEVTDA